MDDFVDTRSWSERQDPALLAEYRREQRKEGRPFWLILAMLLALLAALIFGSGWLLQLAFYIAVALVIAVIVGLLYIILIWHPDAPFHRR